MTTLIRIRFAQFAVVALALFASSAFAATIAQTADHGRRVLVLGGDAATTPQTVARAKAAAARAGADLRVARTTADELGVTHLFAAKGYDTIVTVGLDRRIAITPVAERYPGTRFVATDSSRLDRALGR